MACAHGTAPLSDDVLVQPGVTVILIASDGGRYFAKAAPGQQVRIGKVNVQVSALVGTPYGSVFDIGKNKLVLLPGEEHLTRTEASSSALADDAATVADNRDLVDDGSSQKLTSEAIEELRSSGASGQDIIAALVQNSESWESKTVFSQQKWLARKEKKYAPRVRVVRADAESVCESYLIKNHDKVSNLRFDSLAQILAFANIHAGSQAIVFDTCMGVVLGAVTERLGGHGRILAPYAGVHPSCDAMRQFNFPPSVEASVVHFHTSEIGQLQATAGEVPTDVSEAAVARKTKEMINVIPETLAAKLAGMKDDKARSTYMEKRNDRIRRQCRKPDPTNIRHWLRLQSDSLIIATTFDPTLVLLELWPCLAHAAPFVIFCEFIEPLVQCFREIQKRCIACKLQLSNTWTREYQVLPGRTHPAMHMSACSGFLLTGVKVHKRDDGWHFVEKVTDGRKKAKLDASE